jgi:hypothetical protein
MKNRLPLSLPFALLALQTTVTVLQTANSNLQQALTAEIAARIAADNALQAARTIQQQALDAEIAARIAGDHPLVLRPSRQR